LPANASLTTETPTSVRQFVSAGFLKVNWGLVQTPPAATGPGAALRAYIAVTLIVLLAWTISLNHEARILHAPLLLALVLSPLLPGVNHRTKRCCRTAAARLAAANYLDLW